MRKERIIHHKTITYYLKTNKLIERTNREIKKYLRKYINHEQTD